MSKEKTSGPAESWNRLFLRIVHDAYVGREYTYDDQSFKLLPRLTTPYDFLRTTKRPRNEFDMLLRSLDPRFTAVAKSEMYRKGKGWIDRGTAGYEGMKIRQISVGNKSYLLPVLSDSAAIGVDTTSMQNRVTVLCFCFIPDPEAGYIYLERHLNLPKTHNHREFKWSRLNQDHKKRVLQNFETVLKICCNALLTIITDTLISPPDKLENILTNLIEGCFSGYERMPGQKTLRPALRRKFFSLANATQVHCDCDFLPLTPSKVVRVFVKTLAKRDGQFEDFTPLLASLRSHESKPIQITDVLVGAIRTKMQRNESMDPIKTLPFDKRKIKHYKRRTTNAYFWAIKD